MAEDQTRGEINRLYWGSDASVGEIADQLGVSRRALYDSIDPRPAGTACPDCGSALVFRNRTAAERGEATCPDCGREEPLGTAPPPPGPSAPVTEDPEIERATRGARLSPMPPRAVPGTATGPALGGALLAGLAAGVAVGYLIRRG